MSETEIRRYLSVIKRAVSYIEATLDNDDGGLMEQMAADNPSPEKARVETKQPKVKDSSDEKHLAARAKHIQDLLDIDCWPEAVPEHLTVTPTEEDQYDRARSVLNMTVDRQLYGLHFLDFGCGDGWTTEEALSQGAATALGYDIRHSDNWAKLKAKFTTDFSQIQPDFYNIVFLYDVLDHVEHVEEVMAQVKSVLNPDGGVVYVRCHPWTSKHATHLFKQGVNKAYIHLFLNYEEISKLINDKPMFTRPEKSPLQAYRWWFNDFNILKETLVENEASEFFKVPAFKELLASEQEVPIDQIDDFVENRMAIQFVDYVLSK